MLGGDGRVIVVQTAIARRCRCSSRDVRSSAHGCERIFAEGGGAMGVATETRPWMLEELDRLPDDGNKYELVYGELFVTPPPMPSHEEVIAILHRLVDRYVERWRLGRVYTPKAVIRTMESQVEPDLM